MYQPSKPFSLATLKVHVFFPHNTFEFPEDFPKKLHLPIRKETHTIHKPCLEVLLVYRTGLSLHTVQTPPTKVQFCLSQQKANIFSLISAHLVFIQFNMDERHFLVTQVTLSYKVNFSFAHSRISFLMIIF